MSITPLGERSRQARWGLTIAAFTVASTVAGATAGALAGTLGGVLFAAFPVPDDARLAVLATLLGLGLMLDLQVGGLRLPTVRRQVNEDWLTTYRGWVYGVGFGAQLGFGLVTIVTASAIYVTFAAALLAGGPVVGAIVGASFGLVRALALLPARRVNSSRELVALAGTLERWEGGARRVGVALQALLVFLAIALAVQ